MLKQFAFVAIAAYLTLSSVACAFDPYEDYEVMPGIDDQSAPAHEMPEKTDLSNKKDAVVMLPAKFDSGASTDGMRGQLNSRLLRAINGTGRLEGRVGGGALDAVLKELRMSNSALFSQSGGAKVGKLMKARYVCWISINSTDSSELKHENIGTAIWRAFDDNAPKVYSWLVTGTCNASFTMVDVQTGQYVINQNVSSSDKRDFLTKPSGADHQTKIVDAALMCVRDIEPHIGRAFPSVGYIKDTRGGCKVARLEMVGIKNLVDGTNAQIFAKRKVAGGTGTSYEYRPIGRMTIYDHKYAGEIWGKVNEGSNAIRKGHYVKTEGRGARGFFEKLID